MRVPILVTLTVVVLAALGIPPRGLQHDGPTSSARSLPELMELRHEIQAVRDAIDRRAIRGAIASQDEVDGVTISTIASD